MCRIYDDSALDNALDRPGIVYNRDIDDGLRFLGATLEKIDGRQSIDQLLQDPRLAVARDLARQLLNDLRQFGYDSAG